MNILEIVNTMLFAFYLLSGNDFSDTKKVAKALREEVSFPGLHIVGVAPTIEGTFMVVVYFGVLQFGLEMVVVDLKDRAKFFALVSIEAGVLWKDPDNSFVVWDEGAEVSGPPSPDYI